MENTEMNKISQFKEVKYNAIFLAFFLAASCFTVYVMKDLASGKWCCFHEGQFYSSYVGDKHAVSYKGPL
jgi:hypothetical protein